jgi:zinc D-Ala-D-Ala carboxypeptidase
MFKKIIMGVIFISLIGFTAWRVFSQRNENNAMEQHRQSEQQPGDSFDKSKHSTAEPTSLWMIANKQHALPSGYVPSDLVVPEVRLGSGAEQMQIRAIAAADLRKMFDAAAKDGVTLIFASGYRSYTLQKQLYEGYVARDGRTAADRYSARPGTSEHQTGLAFDAANAAGTCYLEICFATTTEGKWLATHAHEYGFTLRYKNGKEPVTGYQFEPWHFRYVGRELAAELKKTDQTMEEFFGL